MSLDNFSVDLTRPLSLAQLAAGLGIATKIFSEVVECSDPETLYKRHLIPKKSLSNSFSFSGVERELFSGFMVSELSLPDPSRYRTVWEPITPVIKLAHKSAARAIESFLCRPGSSFPHPCAYGFIKGRSTRKNAQCHLGALRLVSVDIKDFFPSITIGRIELALLESGIKEKVAKQLARFLSINGSLPLGLNASPIIANLVALPLDLDFHKMAESCGCSYTRYADDITISGRADVPEKNLVRQVLRNHGFVLNDKKYRESRIGQKHYVTGLSVSDKKAPHAPRKMKKRLRQEIFFIEKFGFDNHCEKLDGSRTRQHEVNRIDGTVNYVASIEIAVAQGLRAQWKDICQKNRISSSFEPRPFAELRRASWFVDEAEMQKPDGTKVLALCVVEAFNVQQIEMDLISLFEEEAGDAFGTGAALSIAKKGLHWVDANWSQRQRVVKLLSVLPIRAFVMFDELSSSVDYNSKYKQLLATLLDTMMRTADDAIIEIIVEANSAKISVQETEACMLETYAALRSKNQRRPLNLPTMFVQKKGYRPAMCMPDIILGALNKYLTSKSSKDVGEFSVSLFEQLRGRVRLVLDLGLGKKYRARARIPRW